MHIVFLTNEFPKEGVAHGGVGTFVRDLGQKLVANGIKVSVVGINNEYKNEEVQENGIQIYSIKKSTWKVAKFLQNTSRILKLLSKIDRIEHIDIVEGAEMSFPFFPKKTSYKKVIRLHGGHHFFTLELKNKLYKWKAFQEKRSFKNADYFVSVSKYVGNQTQKYLNIPFDFTTIYNSVNTEKFKEAAITKVKKNNLLFVGTVCEKKGIKQLILALPAVKEKFPDIVLNIVGRDWFFKNGDSYTEYLKTYITDDLKPHIHFLGAVEHDSIPSLIEQAEICVYPSHMESFGLTLIEAMAMGKPIVFSTIEPFKEIITNEVSGIACNPLDSMDIAQNLIKLLLDTKKAKEMGRNAKNEVVNKFSSDKLVKENISFYKSLL